MIKRKKMANKTYKFISWNVNGIRAVDKKEALKWVDEDDIHLLVVQETKSTDENFPWEELKAAGYHSYFCGQPAYNGVAIISKKDFIWECI